MPNRKRPKDFKKIAKAQLDKIEREHFSEVYLFHIEDLKNLSCHFPGAVDLEGRQTYCGERVKNECSYCPAHCEVVYSGQPPQKLKIRNYDYV